MRHQLGDKLFAKMSRHRATNVLTRRLILNHKTLVALSQPQGCGVHFRPRYYVDIDTPNPLVRGPPRGWRKWSQRKAIPSNLLVATRRSQLNLKRPKRHNQYNRCHASFLSFLKDLLYGYSLVTMSEPIENAWLT